MNTEILPVSETSIKQAAALMRQGLVVAFPTETVYGLGANGLDELAVTRIFEAKGRPADNPLIQHVSQRGGLAQLVLDIPSQAERLMDEFWPGPLTIILQSSQAVPLKARAGLPTVAVRCPENAWARMLIECCGFPIAAPSANLSGRPSPTTAQAVYEDMRGRIPLILDGGPCRVGLESTVLTLCTNPPHVLRPGEITPAMIEAVIGHTAVDASALKALEAGEQAASPGMKYRHYAPNAQVTVVGGEPAAVAAKINELYDAARASGGIPAILARAGNRTLYGGRQVYMLGADGSAQSVGSALYETLRLVDSGGHTHAFAEAVEPEGFGLAVMNRLLRAAGFQYIQV